MGRELARNRRGFADSLILSPCYIEKFSGMCGLKMGGRGGGGASFCVWVFFCVCVSASTTKDYGKLLLLFLRKTQLSL